MENEFSTKGLSRDEIMSLAQFLNRIGRKADASQFATNAIRAGFESSPDAQLSEESRALLSDVLNKRVKPLREAVRNINLTLNQLRPQRACVPPERFERLQEEYRKIVVKELIETCAQVVDLVRDILLPTAKDSEAKVFFNKMAGDFSRYIAENPLHLSQDPGTTSKSSAAADAMAKAQTEEFYNNAYRLAQTTLAPTHATRLGLEMNMAVFYYEIKKDPLKAIQFAKDTYDDAIAELDEEEEEDETASGSSGNPTLSTLKMLKENVELWEKAQEDKK